MRTWLTQRVPAQRDVDGRWQSKRDPSFTAPLERVTWGRDGVRHLAPGLVLSHKVAT
ncbi:MAG: hypothetical protein HOQ27_03255 [Dermatophilaceae bacterium]|nr:hypothetical protein [Dermatophilaceae bacterium]